MDCTLVHNPRTQEVENIHYEVQNLESLKKNPFELNQLLSTITSFMLLYVTEISKSDIKEQAGTKLMMTEEAGVSCCSC